MLVEKREELEKKCRPVACPLQYPFWEGSQTFKNRGFIEIALFCSLASDLQSKEEAEKPHLLSRQFTK